MSRHSRGPRRRFGLLGLLPIGCLVVIVVAALTTLALYGRPASSHAEGPAGGHGAGAHPAGPTASAPIDPAGTGPAAPSAGQPVSLSVPALGLTAQVKAMARPASGAIDPPTASAAYWISSYGTVGPSSDNTAYIAGHTCRGKGCSAVFQPFLDVPDSSTTVHAGDQVEVTSASGTWHYTVTGTELYTKTTIASDTQLWQKVPGRLVLVTCFQYKGGTSSQQNYIIYAQLDPGQS